MKVKRGFWKLKKKCFFQLTEHDFDWMTLVYVRTHNWLSASEENPQKEAQLKL